MNDFESLVDRFDTVAEQQPGDVAVSSPSRETTFAQLAATSNRIGRAIYREGSEGPVALLVDDVDTVVSSMYGVLRAGRFWVVLDTRTPENRLSQIVRDSGATTFLYDKRHEPLLRSIAPHGAGCLPLEDSEGEDGTQFALDRRPRDIAAITYTSGSTGSPKGVVQTEAYLLEHVRMVSTEPDWSLGRGDRRIFIGSPTFGGAIGGLLGTTIYGATLQPFPLGTSNLLELANWMLARETTIYQSTPALFRQLMLAIPAGMKFPSVRRVRIGGDVVTRQDVELFGAHFDDATILTISYSSSECGRIAANEITGSTRVGDVVPVGRPLPGVRVRIVDENGGDVPSGETGQIIVNSPQTATGYWNNGNEEERFESGADGITSFRTGDLGRFDENGELYFCGRVDDQLKIRGFRVEPVEIEAILRTHPAVRDAAVIGKKNDSGDVALHAFATVNSPVKNAELRSHIARALPDYMVPGLIQILDEFPVTGVGKVDRQALGRIDRSSAPVGEKVTPRSVTETALQEIWRVALDSRAVGVRDDFFELGGNSILAARVFAEVEQKFGLRLPLSSLFDAPTIEDQARLLEDGGWEQYYKVLVTMRASGSRPKLFLVAGGGGNVVGFRGLVELLGEDQPVYALQSPWLADDDMGDAGLVEIATRYVEAVRSVQPAGPYFFAGYSSGGTYAYEMAQQLTSQGESVAFLAMLDTACNYGWKRDSMPVRIYRRIAKLARNPGFRLKQYSKEYIKRATRVVTRRGNKVLEKALGPGAPRFELNRRWLPGASDYHAEPYAGRITLIKATQKGNHEGGGPVENWAAFARDGADIVRIEGTHTTMLEDPAVRDLAAAFTRMIDKSLQSKEEDLESTRP